MSRVDAGRILKAVDPYAWRVADPAARALRAVAGRRGGAAGGDAPLIVRPGGMGDLIMCMVALEEMGRDPCAFRWLLERRSMGWAAVTGLDAVAYDAAPRAIAGLAGRHALVINTEQRFGLAHGVARAACAPGGRVVAFATNRAAPAADVRVPYDPLDTHESVAFSRLFAEALGGAPLDAPPPRGRRRPAGGRPVVAISGTEAASRAFPAEAWSAWAAGFHPGSPLAVVCAPADEPLGRAVAASRDADVVCGSLAGACAAIAAAPEVLTVDGGPVHIASYFGVPTRVVFTAGRDAKWAPLAPGSRVFARRDLPCRPCTMWGQVPPCPVGLACKRVGADAAYEATVAG